MVDDGSTEDIVEVVTVVGAVVVSHEVGRGEGSATRTSHRYAVKHGFDVLVLLDGILNHRWAKCDFHA